MRLEIADEDGLVHLLDQASLDLLKLWRTLSEQKLGQSIPVAAASRYACDDPAIASVDGKMNSSSFVRMDGDVYLIVWMEDFGKAGVPFDRIIFFHEVAHQVLLLQGYNDLTPRNDDEKRILSATLSLAHHVPLYALQSSLKQDWQPLIDARAYNNLRHFTSQGFASGRVNDIFAALLLADDLLHCSPHMVVAIREHVLDNVPKIAAEVDTILTLAKKYELTDPIQNNTFQMDLVKLLGLPDDLDERTGVERFNVAIASIKQVTP